MELEGTQPSILVKVGSRKFLSVLFPVLILKNVIYFLLFCAPNIQNTLCF